MLKIKLTITRLLPLFIFAVFSLVILNSSSTLANTVEETDYIGQAYNPDVYEDLSANQHYWWLYSCFARADIDKVTESEIDSWDFFEGASEKSTLGSMYGSTPSRKCSDQNIVKTAFNYLGFSNPRETFCSIPGAQYNGSSGKDECIVGAGGKNWDNNEEDNKVQAAWMRSNVQPKKPLLSNPGRYMRAYTSFVNGCDVTIEDKLYKSVGDVPIPDDGSNGTKYAVPVVVKETDKYVVKYAKGVGIPGDKSISIVANSNTRLTQETTYKKCNELVNEARDTAGAYAILASTSSSTTSNGNLKDAQSGDDRETSCAIDGVGWIVCPLMNFLGDINDKAFGYLDNLLTIRPALITDPSTTKAWSAFRDIANVAFVIAFLIIIYSQISGLGVSNYGIKKLIPKLIAAAVLVNASYIVCAVLVDLSNIVGTSAYELLNSSIDIGEGGPANGAASDTWSGVIGALLKAGVVIGLIAALFLAPMVLLALAMVLLILVGRQAFVILLIVISPLAFVAFLLPNTEDWFKKWWKAFSVTLMVYPVVGIVFGASALASDILMNVANDGGSGDDENMLKIVALSVLAIPLFAVPALIKGSLSALGSVGGKLSGLQDKANGMAKKSVMNGRIGEAKNAFGARRQERKVKRRRGEGKLATWGSSSARKDTRRGKAATFIGTRQKALDESPFGQTIGGDKGAAAAVYQKMEAASDRIRNTKALLEDDDPATLHLRASELLVKANGRGDMDTARAASQVLREGGRTGRQQLNKTLRELENGVDGDGNEIPKLNETLKKGIQADGLGKHKEHDSIINQWSEGKGTFGELAASDKTISRLNQQQLASQDTARLEEALENDTLQKHQAEAVLDGYSKGTISLDDERLKIFKNAAAKPARPDAPQTPPSAPSSSSPAPETTRSPDGKTFEQSDSGLFIRRE